MHSIYYINSIKNNNNQISKKLNILKNRAPPVINTKYILSDAQGLTQAYKNFKLNGSHLYHDKQNKTLYVAGSSNFNDWMDNFRYLVPGMVQRHNIYIETDKYLSENEDIKKIIGHSAGADVVAALNKNNKYESTTYNAPGFVNTDLKNNTAFVNNSDVASLLNFNKNNISVSGDFGVFNILKNHDFTNQFGYNQGNLKYRIM